MEGNMLGRLDTTMPAHAFILKLHTIMFAHAAMVAIAALPRLTIA